MTHRGLVTVVIALCLLTSCNPAPLPTPAPKPQPIRVTLVEVITAETFPVQLTVHVQGDPPAGGCWAYPAAPQPERAGTVITITVSADPLPAGCGATPWRYDANIPLGSDFATGEYTLRVNSIEQTFRFDSGFGP